MANNIFRESPGRLRSGNLTRRILGGNSQLIANEFFEAPIVASGGYLVQPPVVDSIGGTGILNITITPGSTVLVQHSGTIDVAIGGGSCVGSIVGAYTFINESRNNYFKSVNQFYFYNHPGGTETITCTGINSSVVVAILEIGGLDNSSDPLITYNGALGSTSPLQANLTFASTAFLTMFWYNEGVDDYTGLVGVDTVGQHSTSNFNLQATKASIAAGSYNVGVTTGGSADNVMVCAAWRVASTSPSAYTLSASKGTFAETGKVASLLAGRKLSSSKGAFAETGKVASLLKGYRVLSSKGSFTETGKVASLLKGYRLQSSKGSFSETGKVASLLKGYRVLSSKGGFTVTGKNASLIYTPVGSYVMTASKGAFAINGKVASLTAQRKVSASKGTFVETGKVATLSKTWKLLSSKGVFAETGKVASLTAQRKLSASKRSLTVTGKNASLLKAWKIQSAKAGYTITGKVANLFVTGAINHYVMSSLKGTFTVGGKVTSLRYNRRLAASKGLVTATGYTASLLKGWRTLSSKGSFLINGKNVNLLWTIIPTIAVYFQNNSFITGRVRVWKGGQWKDVRIKQYKASHWNDPT